MTALVDGSILDIDVIDPKYGLISSNLELRIDGKRLYNALEFRVEAGTDAPRNVCKVTITFIPGKIRWNNSDAIERITNA